MYNLISASDCSKYDSWVVLEHQLLPEPVRAHLYESADERDRLVTSVLDLTLDLDLLTTAVGASVKGNFEANWRGDAPEATVRLLTKGRLPRLQIHQIRLG